MNLDTWERTNGRIERQKRASRQHECLQTPSEIFCINSCRVISPFSINSFASASVCARLDTTSSSNVTGLLSGSAIVLSSFDYLFRSHHHHRWNRQAKSLGGLKVDHQLKFGWLFHRQVGGL